MRHSTWRGGGVVAAAVMVSCILLASCTGGVDVTAGQSRVTVHCDATTVHYTRYQGVQAGLEQLPWIVAAPHSAEVVGHLFYYDHRNAWQEERLSPLRMYSGGESPDGRLSMKILWELRRGSAAPFLDLLARRIDGPGTSLQQLPSTSSDPSQFPSIIDIPRRGCWRLTLKAGATTDHVVVVVQGK
jgi:hypothetical protein